MKALQRCRAFAFSDGLALPRVLPLRVKCDKSRGGLGIERLGEEVALGVLAAQIAQASQL